ncbi:hypothetical protein AKJ16_DCAP00836, partial [Drosera capensis]
CGHLKVLKQPTITSSSRRKRSELLVQPKAHIQRPTRSPYLRSTPKIYKDLRGRGNPTRESIIQTRDHDF